MFFAASGSNIEQSLRITERRNTEMKVIFERYELTAAVTNVMRAVSTKNTIPALEGILLKTTENTVVLCGYDLDIGIRTEISATVIEGGEIVLSAKLFSDMVKRLPDNTVTLETDDKLVSYIHSGVVNYQIIGMSSYEYPELPTFETLQSFRVNTAILKNMIRQTNFAVSDNMSKPIYTGSLFDLRSGFLNIVSIDGFRMAVRKEKIASDINFSFVVPGKTLGEILKFTASEESDVQIIVGKKHVVFKIENYSVISRLIEGKFIEYEGTIPKGASTKLKVKTKEITAAVERMSLLTNDKMQSPVRVIVADEGIKLHCTTVVGKASDYIEVAYEGDEVEIGFNNKYLLDALKNSETDELIMEFNGPLKPLKILPTEGDSFVFLVVPMRLS